MFDINRDTMCGFQMKFDNGYTVSVQWSPVNYCSNNLTERNNTIGNPLPCPNAEVAVFDDLGQLVQLNEESDVEGYCSPEEVLDIMAMAACMPPAREIAPPVQKKKPHLYLVK